MNSDYGRTPLQDLKARGMKESPLLAIADGALGFWKALEESFPGVPHQQCWVHKTANLLGKLPKRLREDAKSVVHEMYIWPLPASWPSRPRNTGAVSTATR